MHQVMIVDYGMGNIASVVNAFRLLDMECLVTNDPKKLNQASGIILPGVGAYYSAMQNLQKLGLVDALHDQVIEKKKVFLGICLGLQLIATQSTEQQLTNGLGWVQGNVVRIEEQAQCPVPHVGWNEVHCSKNSLLFKNIDNNSHFFFDHSYHLQCNADVILGTCDYGGLRVASVEKDNIFAVQFHPEKSQRTGLKLLRNFLNIM